MRDWPKDCWNAAIIAGCWWVAEKLLGNTIGLGEFALSVAAWGALLWCGLALYEWWQASRRMRLEYRLSELERELKERYTELTGKPWGP